MTVSWNPSEFATSYILQHKNILFGEDYMDWRTVYEGPETEFFFQNTLYCSPLLFRVAASNEYGISEWSGALSEPAGGPHVDPPTNISPTTIGDTFVQFSWSPSYSFGLKTYEIQSSSDNGQTWSTSFSGETQTGTVSGLQPFTEYVFRFRALVEGKPEPSMWSEILPQKTRTLKPDGVSAEVLSSSSVRISCNAVPHAESYFFFRSLSATGAFSTISAGNPSTSFTDTQLDPSRTYYYRVSSAVKSIPGGIYEVSPRSEVVSALTHDQVSIPDTPQNITIQAPFHDCIYLKWDIVPGASSYYLQRSRNGVSAWSTVESAITTNSYTDTGLLPQTAYYYRLQSENAVGFSPWSDVISIKTPREKLPPPPVPGNLHATAISQSEVQLNWSGSGPQYSLERFLESSGQWIVIYTGTSESFLDYELEKATYYQYRVRSLNEDGASEYSPIAGAKTFDFYLDEKKYDGVLRQYPGMYALKIFLPDYKVLWSEKQMHELIYQDTDQGRVYEHGSGFFLARIALRADQSPLSPSRVSAVKYSAYLLDETDPGKKEAVFGHENVEVDVQSSVLESPVVDGNWPVDSLGYNFKHEPISTENTPLFPFAGRNYRIEYRLRVLDEPNDIILKYRVRAA